VTFRNYLHQFKPTYYKTRDFAQDARADRHLPEVSSWKQLESYLRQRGACDEAVSGARLAWEHYERTLEP
jgi:hypothetical protein